MTKRECLQRVLDHLNPEPTEADLEEAKRYFEELDAEELDVEDPDVCFGYCDLCRRVEAEMNCLGSATLEQHVEACEKANCGHPPYYRF